MHQDTYSLPNAKLSHCGDKEKCKEQWSRSKEIVEKISKVFANFKSSKSFNVDSLSKCVTNRG